MPERQQPSARRLFALLGVVLPLGLAAAVPRSRQGNLEGEYGLRVTIDGDDLGVGWLSSGGKEGVLEVSSGGRTVFRTETPLAGAHFATFRRPDGDTLVLRYGAPGEDLYATTLYFDEDQTRESGVLPAMDSLFVVGDVHGEYDRLLGVLQNGGLVDGVGHWAGGTHHVVFVGDIFDRGPDATKALWFLYRLEREARAAGGGAHLLLGNHETMIFTHDTRYTSDKEQLIARLHGVSYPELYDPRTSVLGRWLASRPSVMRVGGVLLAHGGVGPWVTPHSVEALNDSLRKFMSENLFYEWSDTTVAIVTDSALARQVADRYSDVIVIDSTGFQRRADMIFGENSIFWYRGYVESDTLKPALDSVLRAFDADVHVVGHTPLREIESHYGGELISTDMIDHAGEMLLLVRDDEGGPGYRRWRIGPTGPPEPF
jgi:Calcineurin-like phosphoesterase